MNSYDIDTLVTVQSAFTTAAGTPTDPTTVTLFLRDPNGLEQTIAMGSLTHVGAGVFSYAFLASISGTWFYKFQGTGALQVTSPDTPFFIRSSKMIPG